MNARHVVRIVCLMSVLLSWPVGAAAPQPAFPPPGLGTAPDEPSVASAGQWSLTGSMNWGRAGHTATLLRDGRVLVVGSGISEEGGEPGLGLAAGDEAAYGASSTTQNMSAGKSAELYDPRTGQWSLTAGGLQVDRGEHTATLLQDGRVLVAGGMWSSQSAQSAEVYDPASGQWTQTPNMPSLHYRHTATLLQDGRVLIAGGYNLWDAAGDASPRAELYNPRTNTWSAAGQMTVARASHTATLLDNGKVLVAGGRTGSFSHGSTTSSAELYDPATNTWSRTGDLTQAVAWHRAMRLSYYSWVLVVGGGDSFYTYANMQMYKPEEGKWYAWGKMREARYNHAAAFLADGYDILVVGGARAFKVYNDAEVWDYNSGACSAAGTMSTSRMYHTATLLDDGRVLVVGGWASNHTRDLNSAELYAPFSVRSPARVYLPLMSSFWAAPDLEVRSLAAADDNLLVTLHNTGNAPVTDEFWVDLYINPSQAPSQVNQTWQMLSAYGAVWGVTTPALPLEPGGVITLTLGDEYYWPVFSHISGTLPAGTSIHVQADSYNPATAHGLVLEDHELGYGGEYNNVAGLLLGTLITPRPSPALRPAALPHHLPPR